MTLLNDKQRKILDKVVLQDKHFVGRDKLYKYVSSNYPEYKISRRGVMEYINNNETFQLFRNKRSVPEIRSTLVKKPYYQIGIDLIDMSTWEMNNMKWILNSMDLFTRKSWCISLPNKESKTVSWGMDKLLTQMNQKPLTLRSDNDSSFKSPPFINMLKKHGIKHVFSNPHKPQSNGAIEKRNHLLQRQLKMIRTQEDDRDWTKYLNKVNNNLNNQYNTVIKMTPNEAEDKHNEEKVYNQQLKSVRKRQHLIPPTYKIGDRVRIKLEPKFKTKFDYNYSKKIYTIYKVYRPHRIASRATYKLSIGKVVLPKLYSHGQLLKVKLPKTLSKEEPLKRKPKIYRATIINGVKHLEIKYPNEKKTLEPYEDVLIKYPKLVRSWEKRQNLNWSEVGDTSNELSYIEKQIVNFQNKINNLQNQIKNKKSKKPFEKKHGDFWVKQEQNRKWEKSEDKWIKNFQNKKQHGKPKHTRDLDSEEDMDMEEDMNMNERPKRKQKHTGRLLDKEPDKNPGDIYLLSDSEDDKPTFTQNPKDVKNVVNILNKPGQRLEIYYDDWVKIKQKNKDTDLVDIENGKHYNYVIWKRFKTGKKKDQIDKDEPGAVFIGEAENDNINDTESNVYYNINWKDRILYDKKIFEDIYNQGEIV